MKTPFRPEPESIQKARALQFEPPLDAGIREIVITLVANGVETADWRLCAVARHFSAPCGRAQNQSLISILPASRTSSGCVNEYASARPITT